MDPSLARLHSSTLIAALCSSLRPKLNHRRSNTFRFQCKVDAESKMAVACEAEGGADGNAVSPLGKQLCYIFPHNPFAMEFNSNVAPNNCQLLFDNRSLSTSPTTLRYVTDRLGNLPSIRLSLPSLTSTCVTVPFISPYNNHRQPLIVKDHLHSGFKVLQQL
eukprot:TRINITY_DN2566_c0_g1_i1.p1 TRINITY_DN2566_c0_g1~~TRINITY_DN2566_c0_g1_i1.p1  ORF type:complete len:162 (-),score=13.23 TRINITY_DN2566_c0_g1_i1:232-717(-)